MEALHDGPARAAYRFARLSPIAALAVDFSPVTLGRDRREQQRKGREAEDDRKRDRQLKSRNDKHTSDV